MLLIAKTRPIFSIIFSLCFIVVIFIIFFIHQYHHPEAPTSLMTSSLVHEATSFDSLPNAAFVFLGLGAQANQMNCPAAIESLVRYGGWNGKVYLITDQPRCFNEKEIIHHAKITNSSNFQIISLNENFATGGIDWKHSNVGFRKSRIQSKSMKGKLFELIPDPSIELIAYVDCDVLFTTEGCPKQFIEASSPWKSDMLRLSHVYADPTTGEVTGLHAGAFVAHRNYSRKILNTWHDRTLTTNDGLDRVSLLAMYQEGYLPPSSSSSEEEEREESSERKRILGSEFFLKPNKLTYSSLLISKENHPQDPMNWFERFLDPMRMETKETIPCITHISKARCEYLGREVVQSFVNHFQLQTYRKEEHSSTSFPSSSSSSSYSYCPHHLIQPLANGWFPFGYLPFCPKLEMIL